MIKEALDAVGNISNIFGVIGGTFAFLVWIKLRRQQKALIEAAKNTPPIPDFKEAVKYHKKVQTINPYALAISLLPTTGSIKKEVEEFLRGLGDEYAKMPVEEIDIDGIDPQKNLDDFVNQVRAKRRELDAKGLRKNNFTFLTESVYSSNRAEFCVG